MGSDVINVTALIASFFSLGITVLVATRQLRIAQSANRLPVIIDHFYRARTPSFRDHEERIWTELSQYDPSKGFAGLPADIRGKAWEVALFYQHLAYLVAFEVVDRDMALLPVHYRMIQSWDALEPVVLAERSIRGEMGVLLLRAFEQLTARARTIDAVQLSERVGRRLMKD